MTGTTLSKVGDRIYVERDDDGGELTWVKRLESLRIDLHDVRVFYTCSVDRPELPIGGEYAEKEARSLDCKGTLQDRTIQVIRQDGSLSNEFDVVEVSVHPIDENLSQETHGYLRYVSGELLKYEHRRDPYVNLDLYIPALLLLNTINVFSDSHAKKRIAVHVYVDVFQPEFERSLAEPWMKQRYYIEDNSNDVDVVGSTAYFRSLTIARADPVGSSPTGNVEEDSPDNSGIGVNRDLIEDLKALIAAQSSALSSATKAITRITVVLVALLFVLIVTGFR